MVSSVVGHTKYLEEPHKITAAKWESSGRKAAPNGSLMRTHPIGVIGIGLHEEDTLSLSIDVGWTTHVDPRCAVSCCIEMALVRDMLCGEIMNEAHVNDCIERCYKWLEETQF